MNYAERLNQVNNEIEIINARLADLMKEGKILTKLLQMQHKMVDLEKSLAHAPEQNENPEQQQALPADDSQGNKIGIYHYQQTKKKEDSFLIENDYLENDFCTFQYSVSKKDISGQCKKDRANLPMCYNRTKRSHKKAWAALVEQFNEETTMSQGMAILRENGLKMHSWASMD